MRQSGVPLGRRFLIVWMAALCVSGLATPAPGASMPPRYRFETLALGRVNVHFHREVDGPARRAAALVLEILPRLEARFGVRVPGLHVLVHDTSDSPNGLALAFPYPLVEIRTASFDGADSGPTESWLRMVVTHELTHIVHLEQAGGAYRFGRRIFGRAPFLFPDALQPAWFIEGLAVREETRGTAFGRGRHTFTKMVVDEAARSGQLSKMAQATLGLDLWPQGNAPYLFGSEFLAFVERERGADASRNIAIDHARGVRPYLDARTFREATGETHVALWKRFAALRAEGLETPREPQRLTTRGALQTAPRLSPDGATLAYTSRTLTGMGEIRLMAPDGSDDRKLTHRTSGSALSWSRDGAFLVFDETHPFRRFESRSDLFRVDLATRRRTRLTTGLRASDPDIGPPSGAGSLDAPIVFVQRFADRTELSLLGSDGGVRVLTASDPGVEWSHPRFSPSGDAVVAARLRAGFLDIVLVDPASGSVADLTHDRALDAEPAWVDERSVVFRSDREDASFQLFVVDREGGGISRLSASPVNAFAPEVDATRGAVFFSRYTARGYDLARAPFERGVPATAFADDFPAGEEEPPPVSVPARPYSVWPSLGPRFFSPFAQPASGEWRLGAGTGSFDALSRVTWGVAGSWGTQVARANGLAYVRYDRFTPSVTLFGRFESSPDGEVVRDLKETRLTLDYPLERSVLRSQNLSLTLRRRREVIPGASRDGGVLALGWQLDTTKTYPLSISPQDGVRLRVSATRETRALGSDLDFGKVVASASGYLHAGRSVLAARVGGALAIGPRTPRRAFAVGGLPSPALLDPVEDAPAILRGYDAPISTDPTRFGTRLAFGTLEWRVPLAFPQRGYRAFPFFVRHLHFTASLDAAAVSERTLNLARARVGVSAALGANLLVGHRFPVTVQAGLGRGLTRDGATVPWVSLGFPF